MRSKISFFNRTIFKKDLTRFWMFPLAYFAMELLLLPITVWVRLSQAIAYENASKLDLAYQFSHYVGGNIGVAGVAILAEAVVICVFSYLYSTRTAYMMHAFPVKRSELFATGFLSSLVLMIIPQVLIAAGTLAVGLSFGVGVCVVFEWLLYEVLLDIFFVGFASCIAMISGQMLASVAFYMIFNFLYLGMELAIRIVGVALLAGIDEVDAITANPLTPIAYLWDRIGINVQAKYDVNYSQILSMTINMKGLGILALYAVAGIAFAFLGYFIYRRKKMETVNDFIAVPCMKYVFVFGMSFFCSIVMGTGLALIIVDSKNTITYNGIFFRAVIYSMIFAAILFYLCQMLVDKTFRVFTKTRAKIVGVYMAYMVIFFLAFKVDFFNFESKVPKAENVTELQVSVNNVYTTTDPAEIAEWVSIHKEMVADTSILRDVKYADISNYCYIEFAYVMNNGQRIRRSYRLAAPDGFGENYEATCKNIESFLNRPERIKQGMIRWDWETLSVENVHLAIYSTDENGDFYGDYRSVELSKAQKDKVYQAVLKDIDEGHLGIFKIGEYRSYNDFYNELNLELRSSEKARTYYGTLGYYDMDYYVYPYIIFNADCTNTIQALIDIGLINSVNELTLDSEATKYY